MLLCQNSFEFLLCSCRKDSRPVSVAPRESRRPLQEEGLNHCALCGKKASLTQSLGASWQWVAQKTCLITEVRATAITSQRQPCAFSGPESGLASLDSRSWHYWNSSQLHYDPTRKDRFTKKTVSDPEAAEGSEMLLGGAWNACWWKGLVGPE